MTRTVSPTATATAVALANVRRSRQDFYYGTTLSAILAMSTLREASRLAAPMLGAPGRSDPDKENP